MSDELNSVLNLGVAAYDNRERQREQVRANGGNNGVSFDDYAEYSDGTS